MSDRGNFDGQKKSETFALRGGRSIARRYQGEETTIEITNGRIRRILKGQRSLQGSTANCREVDLTGYWVMPGLVNAHDHLEYALFPRLGHPPYHNYVEWGEDIHEKCLDEIAQQRAVPKRVRLWWGGIRNLLCGVTSVSHHGPLWPELQQNDFPVRVVKQYGWTHSVALGGNLRAARSATPKDRAFILHAGEGVDELARTEFAELDRLGLLDACAVLVHGLALDHDSARLLNERECSLIICPSSNEFLFAQLPDIAVMGNIQRVALGNDSPLTAAGDLLDELRFAVGRCGISPMSACQMVTQAPAGILRLSDGEGSLEESGVADLVAIRDVGISPLEKLESLSKDDVELVMIRGQVQLASDEMLARFPKSMADGLEPLCLGEVFRWVRAPVQELLRSAEDALGMGHVRLGNQIISVHANAEVRNAC